MLFHVISKCNLPTLTCNSSTWNKRFGICHPNVPIFLLPRNSHEISGGNSSQHTNILVSPIGGIDLQKAGKSRWCSKKWEAKWDWYLVVVNFKPKWRMCYLCLKTGTTLEFTNMTMEKKTWMKMYLQKKQMAMVQLHLVGGFNRFEKYESNCIISPGRDEHKNIFETTT